MQAKRKFLPKHESKPTVESGLVEKSNPERISELQ
jgi:hypothetical protein